MPQDPFYRMAAEECVESGIGVNLFLFPSQYIDAATLGASSSPPCLLVPCTCSTCASARAP